MTTLDHRGHTVTITDDRFGHAATCTCGWDTEGDRLEVADAAWDHVTEQRTAGDAA